MTNNKICQEIDFSDPLYIIFFLICKTSLTMQLILKSTKITSFLD